MTPVAEEERQVIEEESDELIDYLQVLWKHRWMIVTGTLAMMAAALVVSLIMPRTYQASMFLEVGKAFVSGKGDSTDALILIENPQTIAQVLAGDATLFDLRKFLKLDKTTILDLKRALSVRVIKNDPDALLELSLKANDPQQVVDGLNFLADRVIADHRARYEAALVMIDRESQGLREKIAANDLQRDSLQKEVAEVHEQIATELRYRGQLSSNIDRLEAELIQNQSGLAKSNPSSAEAVLGQGIFQSLDLRINDLKTERNKTYSRIGEWRAEIYSLESRMAILQAQTTDYQSAIVRFANTRARSENTNVRSVPVLPTKPVAPRMALNMVVAGVLGVMVFVMAAFLREYIHTARQRRVFASNLLQ